MAKIIKTSDLTEHLERTRGLERDYLGELVSSRKRAWRITFAAIFLALAAVLAVAGLTPFKQPPEMYVVRVDNATGSIEHLSQLGVPLEDYGERIARYFLNTYVLNCESYSWQTVQEQFDTCALLSSQPIQTVYGKRFEGEQDLTKKLGFQSTIDVDIHSITLGANQSATVRFTAYEKDVVTGKTIKSKPRIATIAYDYVNVPLTEDIARINPLGFQVTRYDLAADISRN